MTAPDKQEPPHRWKAFLDSLPSTVSQRLSAHDIRHIFRYFDAAKPKSGEVVLSITQGQLELWVGALAVAFPSMGRRDKADAEELLTVIRSQTGGES